MSTVKALSPIIKKNNLLSRNEEIYLARKIKKGDTEARRALIEANYRLVISIAKKYYRPGHNFDDLIQESSTGLLKAVDRFDPELGYKFSTYACWWIKQATLQYINDNASILKIPTHSRMLASRIKSTIREYNSNYGYTPSTDELSEILNVTKEVIENTLKNVTTSVSIDQARSNSDDEKNTLLSKLEDETYANPLDILEKEEMISIIKNNMKLLSSREEKVLRLRFGLIESGSEFRLSKEEIEEIKNA